MTTTKFPHNININNTHQTLLKLTRKQIY